MPQSARSVAMIDQADVQRYRVGRFLSRECRNGDPLRAAIVILISHVVRGNLLEAGHKPRVFEWLASANAEPRWRPYSASSNSFVR